jgi:hypothetical protein
MRFRGVVYLVECRDKITFTYKRILSNVVALILNRFDLKFNFVDISSLHGCNFFLMKWHDSCVIYEI